MNTKLEGSNNIELEFSIPKTPKESQVRYQRTIRQTDRQTDSTTDIYGLLTEQNTHYINQQYIMNHSNIHLTFK